MRSAWLLCVFVSLVSGCGFRSGLDESSFSLESFALDQTSYVQGETGTATAVFRNAGPRPAFLPDVLLSVPEGAGDFVIVRTSENEDELAPGDETTVTFSLASTETAEPRTADVLLSFKHDPENIEPLEERTFTLARAATLRVNAIAYRAPPSFGVEPIDYTCRGVEKPAFATVTVENIGTTTAVLGELALTAGEVPASFESHGDEGNPDTIAPGAIVDIDMSIQALDEADAGDDYTLRWLASYTDAVTGHARPAPAEEHADVFLTVHIPASFEISIEETADAISTGAPAAGRVAINYLNLGTVPGRINFSSIGMFAGDTTTSEYGIPAPAGTFPFTVDPGLGGEIEYDPVTLTSSTPTLGETEVNGLIDVSDEACGKFYQQTTGEGSAGAWVVE